MQSKRFLKLILQVIESGKVKGVPLEESLARARKIAGL